MLVLENGDVPGWWGHRSFRWLPYSVTGVKEKEANAEAELGGTWCRRQAGSCLTTCAAHGHMLQVRTGVSWKRSEKEAMK